MADARQPRVIPPVKWIYDTNSLESKALVGTAKQAMMTLERLMEFQGLDQYSYRVEPYPGAMIVCSKTFGLRVARILTGTKRKGGLPSSPECLCTCNFTTGYIFDIEPDNLDKGGADVTPLYTILACVGKRAYRVFDHVLASDFTKYEVGQKIILIPYQWMAYLCCATPTGPSGCRPQRSGFDITHDNWRTTYRIIPWCGLRIPKWIRG